MNFMPFTTKYLKPTSHFLLVATFLREGPYCNTGNNAYRQKSVDMFTKKKPVQDVELRAGM
jgi:hypothetical protein